MIVRTSFGFHYRPMKSNRMSRTVPYFMWVVRSCSGHFKTWANLEWRWA